MSLPSVILLNGATSAGKSSLTRALQARLPKPYLHMGVDSFLAMLPPRLHDSTDGVRFTRGGAGEVQLRLRPAGQALERAFHRSVRAAVDQGLRVIVGDVLLEPWLLQDWVDALNGVDLLIVGVFCRLEELERRELARGDRVPGQARSQVGVVHAHVRYDLTVDTSELTIDAAAERVAAHVEHLAVAQSDVARARSHSKACREDSFSP